jgi:putative transposase
VKEQYPPDKHYRRSVRLMGYDYAQEGAYFVTICTQNRTCLFGEVVNSEMRLTDFGAVAQTEWLRTAELRSNVALDAFVVMPNHVHGVVVIVGDEEGTARRAPTIKAEQFGKPAHGSLPTIVRAFKSAVTKRINEMRGTPGASVWQSRYYEHVIRNEDELHRVRRYIIDNPLRWELDTENPSRKPGIPADVW